MEYVCSYFLDFVSPLLQSEVHIRRNKRENVLSSLPGKCTEKRVAISSRLPTLCRPETLDAFSFIASLISANQ
jgi:hypothetical protein